MGNVMHTTRDEKVFGFTEKITNIRRTAKERESTIPCNSRKWAVEEWDQGR